MVGEVIVDRYELEELVGTGGMSSVFRAHDRLLERTVALKILHEQFTRDEEYVERFRREARAVAQLAHPNIVTVIDRGEQDGRQYIVFEYIEGGNLKEVVSSGPLPVGDAIGLAVQVASALAFAHGRGIVHRDIKPQNVLLNDEGRAKVTDFGIARSLDVQGVTQTGTVLGTSDYIAPEQARGQQVDPRTDMYSLGVVLYELLRGDVPYSGDTFVTVAMQHLNEPVPSVLEWRPDCPVRLDLAIQRAMAKEPEDRFGSMEEFLAELQACAADTPFDGEGATMIVKERLPSRRPRSRARRGRRLPRALLLGVLAIAAIAAGAFVLLRDGDNGTPAASGSSSKPVRLSGIGAEDPTGDGEHDSEAPNATDRDPGTYWTTESYRSWDKEGVGVILRAPRPVALSRVTVTSDTPGFPAVIRASSSATGGFVPVSRRREVGEATAFEIDTGGRKYPYYEVWLQLPDGGRAHVNEVRART